MSLEKEISKGIMDAMKAKDAVRLSALRNIKKFIIEAKTSGASIEELPDADVVKIISRLVRQGKDSAQLYRSQSRPDLAGEEEGQVAVMEEFLPKRMTDGELTEAVKRIIAETGASSLRGMGQVMGVASKTLAGKADGKDIAAKVKELLS